MYLEIILTIIAISFILFLLEITKIRKLLQGSNDSVKLLPIDTRDNDDLYNEAKELVLQHRKASASFIQRKLRIGYARAAHLLDMLEDNKVIGPSNGSEPREVLIEANHHEEEEE